MMRISRRIIIILSICFLLSVILYFVLNNINKNTFLIWQEGEVNSSYLTKEIETNLTNHKDILGIDKFNVLIRSSKDRFYDISFSLNAVYSCDIFILKSSEFLSYMDSNLFMPIIIDGIDNKMVITNNDDEMIGIKLSDDYILGVNKNTRKSVSSIIEVINIIRCSK